MTDKSQLPEEPFWLRLEYASTMFKDMVRDYKALRAAYEAQKAEIALLKDQLMLTQKIKQQGLHESERRAAELEAALKKYGSHFNGCARVITFAATCTCGFDEALKGTK